MPDSHIFISHASKDDPFVKELREALESHRLNVWVDSRNLRGGNKLAPEISAAIEQARQTIVVLSPNTINSPWVRREIKQALAVEKLRSADGYRVIPLMLPGVEPAALALWFDEEPVGARVELRPGGLSEALPDILAALGERLPDDRKPQPRASAKPVAELSLELSDPKMVAVEGGRRAAATATIIYQTADGAPKVESTRFTFTAPLGPIEADDLRWYLEKFYLWPLGVFKERADRIEAQLPRWGESLYQDAARTDLAKKILHAWENAAAGVERRFSIFVDSDLPEGASQEEQAAAKEAASLLLALPWELLHDGRGFLFHGNNPVRVRRRLPNRHPQPVVPTRSPIRILLVSPRPEQPGVGYIDHRISARPLTRAVAALGGLAALTVLAPPTFQAMQEELRRAADAGQPYDVVHFDGHGIYDRKMGLGGLCFEDPKDADKLEERAAQLVYAEKLAEVMRDHRIPLVFLEACQSAQADTVEASVAASLLNEGVTSVVAMTHSVLVETAHRFVAAFYHELARGARVGTAMLAGQQRLQTDTYRGRILGAGELRLQDWFVPVLYQEEQDPRLVTQLPSEQAQQLEDQQRRLSLGALPDEPPHSFIGRSRELLALERMLCEDGTQGRVRTQGYAVLRGQGGEGKTTLAAELARWLVETNRFRRAAFVSLEHYTDARGVLDSLGRQLVPTGESYSVAQYRDLAEALQPVARALSDHPTVIVVDNCESVLPTLNQDLATEHTEGTEKTSEDLGALGDLCGPIFQLCQALLRAHPATRILFTSRESLPAPFNHRHRERRLGRLDRDDAIELVGQVMKQEGLEPKHDDAGRAPQEVEELVNAVGRHARALTLLARELARQGVRATTTQVQQIMAALERRHPGDRENSLYASVELSLRRLPPDLREQVKALAVFHGGAHLVVLASMLNVGAPDVEGAQRMATALIKVGLAEAMPYGHLRLDPAISNYLQVQMDAADLTSFTERWAEAMQALTRFLVQQHFQNTQLAHQLALLELPNLLAMLAWAADALPPKDTVDLAGSVESLLALLGRPLALAQVVSLRATSAQHLGTWGHAKFEASLRDIERLMAEWRLPEAKIAIDQLLQSAIDAGETAYEKAAYDIAGANWFLGQVLRSSGTAEAALTPLAEAQSRFQLLAEAGDTKAEGMVASTISLAADCLFDLGRFDEAATAYEEAIRRVVKLSNQRHTAIGRGNLGRVRMRQKRYNEALTSFQEACRIFELLEEPDNTAIAWHHIGIVHSEAGQFEQAERAHRQTLTIRVQQQDSIGEALSLGELGNLYQRMGRLEEAATFYRQAVEIYAKLKDLRYEGVSRSNLAITLIKLQRYDEARRELLRAIECKKPFGHAAEPWKTWMILHHLEQATGHAEAAAQARQQAIGCYLAYRRAGGENQGPGAQLYAQVAHAIAQGATAEAAAELAALADADAPAWVVALLPRLQAILGGDRAPALAADPALDYDDAAELQLLLENLGRQ